MLRVPQRQHRRRNNETDWIANRRDHFDDRRVLGAELMSAPSSPGRTWRRVGSERGLCALARTLSTSLHCTRTRHAHVSSVASETTTASSPHTHDAGHSVDEYRHESGRRPRCCSPSGFVIGNTGDSIRTGGVRCQTNNVRYERRIHPCARPCTRCHLTSMRRDDGSRVAPAPGRRRRGFD